MKYATPTAFRTALERRLLTTARDSGVPLVRLRKLVVFDRLMARLLVVGSNMWTLKGAVALNLRLGMQFRTTMDMDLARHDTAAAVSADFLAAESLELDDYFTFTTRQVRPPGPSDQAGVVRYHVTAQVAGRLFEDVTVDISLIDPLIAEFDLLRGPSLLEFADIAPIQVPTLPLALHIADKVHAYTRQHAGRPSSRVKDLVDLVLISKHLAVRAGDVRRWQPSLLPTIRTRCRRPFRRLLHQGTQPIERSSLRSAWSRRFRPGTRMRVRSSILC